MLDLTSVHQFYVLVHKNIGAIYIHYLYFAVNPFRLRFIKDCWYHVPNLIGVNFALKEYVRPSQLRECE